MYPDTIEWASQQDDHIWGRFMRLLLLIVYINFSYCLKMREHYNITHMAYSLFDILGPVMHGPSSSHTAGANRIGYLASRIMGGVPEDVELGFHPGYMGSYAGQRSHVGLLAGCLGLREYDENCMDSISLCREKGVRWSVAPITEESFSRNTMRVTGIVKGFRYIVNGESVGGGNIIINRINGLEVHLDGNHYVLVMYAEEPQIVKEAVDRFSGVIGDSLIEKVEGWVGDGRYMGIISCNTTSEQVEEITSVTAPRDTRPFSYRFSADTYC